ncbi:hypothetical protein [Haloarchaeobius sp. DFWS5]|uniref:hypothetical protein n=1 Tax=Haloarchaeobius sp. DFWS5 TaxID=3446114 RepID=UPI003EBC52A9
MFRALVFCLGLIEFLFPKRFVDFWTRVAYETPEEFEVKRWVVTSARLEGLLFVLLALVGMKRGPSADSEGEVVEVEVA